MTNNQIKKILTKLGYSCDVDIPLSEVSSIYLSTDGCLYPDSNTRFNFHLIGDTGILIQYKGSLEDGVFVKNGPADFIDFSIICGFTMVSKKHIPQPFKLSQAV